MSPSSSLFRWALCCLAFLGAFTPVLAKHTKHLSLVDILAVGVDRMQRNFEPMRQQVEAWKGTHLADESAKVVIYKAFVEGEMDVPKHLARRVHDLYFNPQIEAFAPRTMSTLWGHFLKAFTRRESVPKPISAGVKCELQKFFLPDFSEHTAG